MDRGSQRGYRARVHRMTATVVTTRLLRFFEKMAVYAAFSRGVIDWGSRGREFKSRHSDQQKSLVNDEAFFNEIRSRTTNEIFDLQERISFHFVQSRKFYNSLSYHFILRSNSFVDCHNTCQQGERAAC